MQNVLIITREQDLHSDFVIQEIRKLGGDVIRLNTEKITTTLSYSLLYNGCNSFSADITIKDSGVCFSTDSYSSIWYRKPLPVDVSATCSNKGIAEFVNSEYNTFLKEFYELNSHKTWMNSVWSNNKADAKLKNLNLASKLGFRVPKTIVTNKISDAESFALSCDWSVLVKPFRIKGIDCKSKLYITYANAIGQDDFDKFKNNLAFCPTIIQEYIQKQLELRAVVVGDTVFCAAIHSQENELTRHDFRAGETFGLTHTIYTLPETVTQGLLKFNAHYSLQFSTFDIILTPDNEYVFLECNPNGQWYWIEELTKLPIAKAIAKQLLNLK